MGPALTESLSKPFLLVRRDAADLQDVYGSDASLGGQRLDTASNDPACRFEVKDDGAYRVQVRDLFAATRRDPANVYRLSIRRETPDFRLLAVTEPPPKVPNAWIERSAHSG